MIGLGDLYQRRQDAAEAQSYRCAGCGEERPGGCDWYVFDQLNYCEQCYEARLVVVPCAECGSGDRVDDECGLCEFCQWGI